MNVNKIFDGQPPEDNQEYTITSVRVPVNLLDMAKTQGLNISRFLSEKLREKFYACEDPEYIALVNKILEHQDSIRTLEIERESFIRKRQEGSKIVQKIHRLRYDLGKQGAYHKNIHKDDYEDWLTRTSQKHRIDRDEFREYIEPYVTRALKTGVFA